MPFNHRLQNLEPTCGAGSDSRRFGREDRPRRRPHRAARFWSDSRPGSRSDCHHAGFFIAPAGQDP